MLLLNLQVNIFSFGFILIITFTSSALEGIGLLSAMKEQHCMEIVL